MSAPWLRMAHERRVHIVVWCVGGARCLSGGDGGDVLCRYVGKEVVKRAIPMESACDQLVQLIKDHGRWVDPPKEEEEQAPAQQLVAA